MGCAVAGLECIDCQRSPTAACGGSLQPKGDRCLNLWYVGQVGSPLPAPGKAEAAQASAPAALALVPSPAAAAPAVTQGSSSQPSKSQPATPSASNAVQEAVSYSSGRR